MTEIKDLTPDIVTPIIRELVEEFGADYIYKEDQLGTIERQCSYQENGSPSCIVGHVLHRAGVAYNPRWENNAARAVLGNDGASWEVGRSLQVAQAHQDTGHTWGEALRAYEEELAECERKSND